MFDIHEWVFGIQSEFMADVERRLRAIAGRRGLNLATDGAMCFDCPDPSQPGSPGWLIYSLYGEPLLAARKPDIRNLGRARWVLFDLA